MVHWGLVEHVQIFHLWNCDAYPANDLGVFPLRELGDFRLQEENHPNLLDDPKRLPMKNLDATTDRIE